MKCLNCGQLERLHGDPNLLQDASYIPMGDYTQVCGDFEPDHEAQKCWECDQLYHKERVGEAAERCLCETCFQQFRVARENWEYWERYT